MTNPKTVIEFEGRQINEVVLEHILKHHPEFQGRESSTELMFYGDKTGPERFMIRVTIEGVANPCPNSSTTNETP